LFRDIYKWFYNTTKFFKIEWRAEYPNTIESHELQNYKSVHYGYLGYDIIKYFKTHCFSLH